MPPMLVILSCGVIALFAMIVLADAFVRLMCGAARSLRMPAAVESHSPSADAAAHRAAASLIA